MSQILLSYTPCGNRYDALTAFVFGILIHGFNYTCGLPHHPFFVVFIKDSVGPAKVHCTFCCHQGKNDTFENNAIKTDDTALDQT
jgi:hypothetical protein